MAQQELLPTKSPYVTEFEHLYRIYKLEYEATQPEYKVENIRFAHDPDWNHHWYSMQAWGDVERGILKGAIYPLRATVTYAENKIFWTMFDYLDKRECPRARSLPPFVLNAKTTTP